MKPSKLFKSTAAISLLAATLPPVAQATNFSDIKNHLYEDEIIALSSQNIINGYPNGTFQPNKLLSRSDVVKLLGKYLVTLGYTIPSDYKTKMRFTDLNKNSSDELLKYAALVKDTGVFNGSNGALLYNDYIKREHMALVLVRAFSKLNNVDYVSYVQNQTFFEEYMDRDFLTTENAAALRVFDFYDITNDDYFRPKATTTRGEFAGALYNMLKLERPIEQSLSVKNVDMITPERITVTLSNNTTHNIILKEALEENVPKKVNFTINGKSYTETLTYAVTQLKVLDVTNINAGQFVIKFNQPVDLPTVYNAIDIQKLVTLQVDRSYGISLLKAELSEDKLSLKVTTNSYNALTDNNYRVKLTTIHAKNGTTLPEWEEVYKFKKDVTSPVISGVEKVSNNKINILFSEPVNYYSNYMQYKTTSNEVITGITSNYNRNNTFAQLDLTNAKVNGKSIDSNQTIIATYSNLTDLANNKTTSTAIRFTKGISDGLAPRLLTIEQVNAKQFKMTFSEAINVPSIGAFRIIQNGTINYIDSIEQVNGDATSYIVTVDDYLDGITLISTLPGEYIYDISGQFGTINTSFNFTYDPTKPNFERAEVTREQNSEYLYLYFDKNIKLTNSSQISIGGYFNLNGQKIYLNAPKTARIYADAENPKVGRVLLSELLLGIDREGARFTVQPTVTNVTNEYGVATTSLPSLSFVRGSDYNYNYNELKVVSVETSRTNAAIKSNNSILVNFNFNVEATSATNLLNYEMINYKIVSAKVNPLNLKQVELTIENSVYRPTEATLKVENIRAENAIIRMQSTYNPVLLNENIAPTLTSTTGLMIDKKIQLSTAVHTGANELTLTFSEAIKAPQEDDFIVTTSSGESLPVKASISKTDASKIILSFTNKLSRGHVLTVSLKPDRMIEDLYGNLSTFRMGTITIYNYY